MAKGSWPQPWLGGAQIIGRKTCRRVSIKLIVFFNLVLAALPIMMELEYYAGYSEFLRVQEVKDILNKFPYC